MEAVGSLEVGQTRQDNDQAVKRHHGGFGRVRSMQILALRRTTRMDLVLHGDVTGFEL
jgi:hypothetical protein